MVQHENPATGERLWLLPGGEREAGETFEQAAEREVREETGIEARVLRRVRVPRRVPDVTYALFLAEPRAHAEPAPRVDLAREEYLRAAAWHPISESDPLDGLNPAFWGYLAPVIRRLISPRLAIKRAQALVRAYVPEGVSLVDDLIAERRREAALE